MTRALAASLMLSAGVFVADARADEVADPGAADALFASALAALDRGDWAEACPKFDLAMKLDPTVATLFNVAKCAAHDRRFADAHRAATRALEMNAATTDPERRAQLDAFGRDFLAGLAPNVGWLAIRAPEIAGLEVERDGAAVDAPREDTVVDVGAHHVRATAPDHTPFTARIDVHPGEHAVVDVRLARDPPPPSAPEPRAPAGVDGRLVAGLVVGAAGVTSFAVGIGTGVRALDIGAELGARCPVPSSCDAGGVALASSGSAFSTASTVTFVVGGVLAAASIPLFVWSATSGGPARIDRVEATGRGTLALVGSFK